MKSKLKIILPVTGVVLVVALIIGVVLYKKATAIPDVYVSDLVYGFEWGTGKEGVELTMLEKGYTYKKTAASNFLCYEFEDYQGIEGANGNVVFRFDDDKKLTMVLWNFKTSKGADEKSLKKLIKGCEKDFDKCLEQSVDMMLFADDNSLNEYNMYWWNEKSLVNMFYSKDGWLAICYDDIRCQEELIEELEMAQQKLK